MTTFISLIAFSVQGLYTSTEVPLLLPGCTHMKYLKILEMYTQMLGYSSLFPTIFTQGNNSCVSLLASLDKGPSKKSSALIGKSLLLGKQIISFSPTALRKAKIVYNFGLSECVKGKVTPPRRTSTEL